MRAFMMPPVEDGTRTPGPVMALLGASDAGNAISNTATQKAFLSRGVASWMRTLSFQYFRLPLANNFAGGAGYKTADVKTQVDNVLLAAPDTVLLPGGCLRSDIVNGVSYSSSIANMGEIIRRLLAWGICVLITTCPPDSSFTSGQRNQWRRLNDWLIQLGAGRADLVLAANLPRNRYPIVVDVNPYIADPATGGWLSGMALSDGFNPSITGAFWMASAMLQAIGPLLPDRSGAWVDPSALYDATDNPGGNLLSTGAFAGTSGTKASTANWVSSGLAATGWGFSFNGGNASLTSIVLSKENPRLDGPGSGVRQRLAAYNVGIGGSNEPMFLSPASITTNYSTGDTIVAQISYQLVAASRMQSLYLQIAEVGPGSPQFALDGIPGATLSGYPGIAHVGVLQTPPITLQSGVTSLPVTIAMNQDASAGNACLNVIFSDARVFKVA